MPIGHGNLFWLVLESHGKVMEIDFPKRVVTLSSSKYRNGSACQH